MYNRAGQQGKSTDSCPEITELHKDYTYLGPRRQKPQIYKGFAG